MAAVEGVNVDQMTADLMKQCLEDAERLVRERWGSPPMSLATTAALTVTLASALFAEERRR